jgi:nucleotide-binding universal stress UspA family protein
MKNILVHLQGDAQSDRALETGLSLARASNGHLSCIHVTSMEAYVAFDGFGGVFVMNDIITALDEQERMLEETVKAKLAKEDVSWDYEQITGSIPSTIIRHAALSDVVITGREQRGPSAKGDSLWLLGELIHRSRSPLLIPGTGTPTYDPTGPILIAWNGSYEAANAVRAAVPLLALASRVRVVRIDESDEGPFRSVRLMEFLSRHQIHADLHIEPVGESSAAPILIDHAERMQAQTIVMGGYGHSRFGEYLFGGVTRNLLHDCPTAILVAH